MSLKFVQGHMSMDVCKVLLIIHFRPKYCTDIFSVKYWHDLEIWHSRSLQGFWCAIKSRKWGRPYSRPTFGYKTFLRCSKFLPLLSSVLPSTIAIISYDPICTVDIILYRLNVLIMILEYILCYSCRYMELSGYIYTVCPSREKQSRLLLA